MPRSLLAGGLALAASLLAACSSSTSGQGSHPTSAAPSSTPATSSVPATSSAPASSVPASSAPASSAAAPSGLAGVPVQPSDLPSGWTPKPHQANPKEKQQQETIRRCVGAKDTTADELKRVDSPDYELGNATITSNASRYGSQASIASDVSWLRSPKVESCYRTFVRTQLAKELPAGGRIDKVVFQVSPGDNGGPKNIAALGLGVVTVTVNGRTATINADIAFITGPKLEAEVDFTDVGQHVPTALRVKVVEAVAARAAAA